MSFRTQYDRIEVFSNVGSRFHPTYKLKYDEDGVAALIETGKIDIYEQIQSWKDSCDINVILERFENGDIDALNRKTPMFGDFTSSPQTLAEHLQLLRDAEDSFRGLPLDIRAQFNHNPAEFYASIGTDKFNRIMGLSDVGNITEDTVVKEVSINEPQSE